jgi:hypothetical protein
MPNWCSNEVYITGDKQSLEGLMAQATKPTEKYPNPVFLMNNLVPIPPKLLEGEGWYDWRLNNWGCKWELIQDDWGCQWELVPENLEHGDTRLIDQSDTTLELDYSTAWSPNSEFWIAVSEQFPRLIIDHRYVEESMDFMGRNIYQYGVLNKEHYNEIPLSAYTQTGATLNAKGEVDWDIDQSFSLFDYFPDPYKKLV